MQNPIFLVAEFGTKKAGWNPTLAIADFGTKELWHKKICKESYTLHVGF